MNLFNVLFREEKNRESDKRDYEKYLFEFLGFLGLDLNFCLVKCILRESGGRK